MGCLWGQLLTGWKICLYPHPCNFVPSAQGQGFVPSVPSSNPYWDVHRCWKWLWLPGGWHSGWFWSCWQCTCCVRQNVHWGLSSLLFVGKRGEASIVFCWLCFLVSRVLCHKRESFPWKLSSEHFPDCSPVSCIWPMYNRADGVFQWSPHVGFLGISPGIWGAYSSHVGGVHVGNNQMPYKFPLDDWK